MAKTFFTGILKSNGRCLKTITANCGEVLHHLTP